MEVGGGQASGLCKPRLEGEGQLQLGGCGIHNSAPSLDLMDVDQRQTVGDMDDSRLLGASGSVLAEGMDSGAAGADGPSPQIVDLKVDVKVKVRTEELSLVKRRRGRPPRGQPKPTPLPRKSVARDEEDVCFICFDGGSLVLCDRRGCPKAYHPACIKRDDAFFQSKAKWNCGWHICSSCRKASHYMCYTCTFSLCKGCIRDADYQCVRGSKGLCGTCMRTIMLLEKSLLGNSEVVAQVDFDDKSSWEYLFKIYWVYLKQKLSLTLDELARAKNPWKGGGTMVQNGRFLGNCCDPNDGKSGGSDSASRGMEVANSKRKAFKRQNFFSHNVGFLIEKSTDDKMVSSTEGNVWATKELLEFVALLRNGDRSELSQIDVETLVLEYIKENNLRDPQQRSQIICDPMLMNLFGKQRVGHFEMLKLLEYHLLLKERSSSAVRNSKVLDVPVGQVEVKGNLSYQSITDSDRKHRKRKKPDDWKQQTNPEEYAAINVHNINLIYLPRNLIETICGDTNFHDKVVGSIVRIQISRCDQKPDLYRLVQVVGTSKSSDPYAIAEKTTDVMLDILNLDKKEAISLEGISNQKFSEEECWRLRESVKCGLLKRFTVGEVQKKAMALQALKVNDWLESEMLRLNHLHDRASEKGNGKELKELVEKLQLLRSPEERHRRLAEIPEIHADPTMNPSYKSDDDKEVKKTKQGGFKKTCKIGSGRREDDLIYHCGGHDISFDSRSRIQNHSGNTYERNRDICTVADHVEKEGASWPTDIMLESSWFGSKSPSGPKNHGNPTSLTINNGSNQAVVSEVLLPPLSNSIEHFTNDTDMEKMWHYQDPVGNVQGPFSMAQLQKWSSSGHFPLHLRVWKISEMPSNSILLTDALMAQDSKKSLLRYKNQVLSAIGLCSDDGEDQSNDEWSRNLHTNESGSPPDWNRPADVVNSSECRPKSFEQRTANEDSTGTHQSQVHALSISPTLSAQPLQFSKQTGEVYKGEKSTSPPIGNQSSCKTTEVEANSGQSCEKRSDSECCSGQSSGQNWRPLPGNATQDSTNGVISSAKSTEQHKCDLDFPDLPCPTPNADVGFTGQAAEIKQSASSGVLVQDSVPSWSTGSSLVCGRRQLADVAGGWGVYSTAPTKASTEERDSSLITASSLKPAEFTSDCAATPASVNDQFRHPSPSHPTSIVSDWPEIIEPNEFNSLGDESLSDLLAEVEAMESLSELASSTSIMNCSDDLTHGCKIDCFSPIGRLSPNPEMGKGDALSSTGDGHVQSQSTVTDEPLLRLHVFDIDPQMKLAGRSSTSADVDINKKYSDVSTNQWKGGTVLQNLTHFSAALNMDTAENTWRIGSETTWGSADIGWGGLNKGNPSVDWEIRLDSIQEMGSMNSGTSAGNNTTNWYGQPKCSLDLLPSPRDRSNQGKDLDNGRGRSFWNKQPGFGGGNKSGTSCPTPRGQGQRVCKFYESGYCKRGSSCSYLHL